MIEIRVTREFEQRYRELPTPIRHRAEKQTELFRENPFYPSLHTEKLRPKEREMWSFRIDRKYRIIFSFLDGSTVLVFTVGPHDWVYRIRL